MTLTTKKPAAGMRSEKAKKAGPPKFRRRSQARPDEILDAALAVFTERGFDAARVDDIASRAGISKGAVYLYFDSKEALLRGLIEREVAPAAHRLKALADAGGEDPKATLTLLITVATQLLNDARMFATPKLVLSVAPRFAEIAQFYRKRVIDEALGAIASLHRRGVETGVFKDVDSDIVARMVMGPILVHAMRKHVLGATDGASPEARAKAHLEILFEGLAI
ncbi:MAG TPA: TetR/AcrR family transcriptional regulator [Parvularculaceae bacterium]|nr:TetR/AcrR family transcriptional regulator [Parvularculaceae bacterium]